MNDDHLCLVFSCHRGLVTKLIRWVKPVYRAVLWTKRSKFHVCYNSVNQAKFPSNLFILLNVFIPFFFSVPIQAQIVGSGPQAPAIIQPPSGPAQIDIKAPSPNGLSHNTYQQFDIQRPGAILNNSATHTQTQLGGAINANPNIQAGHEAKFILNEIQSTNPSVLRGLLEVAGPKADVIVANPAGITCDGCGFINAGDAALTTAKPVINQGQLEDFVVRGGQIKFEGMGMNALQADHASILARAVTLNAKLYAKELRVGTTNDHLSGTKENPANIPTSFSIDVAALGGMYANHIKLVGSQAGLGVRHAGEIQAGSQGLSLTAQGDLILAKDAVITSEGETKIDASGTVDNQADIRSAGDIKFLSGFASNHNGSIASQRNMALKSNAQLTHQGKIHSQGDVELTSKGDLLQTGPMTALGSIKLHTEGILMQAGPMTVGVDVELLSNIHIAQNGPIEQAQNVRIGGLGGVEIAGQYDIADLLQIVAGNELHFKQSHIRAKRIDIYATNDVSNANSTLAHSGPDVMTIKTGGTIDNQNGTLASLGPMNVLANNVNNYAGLIQAAGPLDIELKKKGEDPVQGIFQNVQGRLLSNQTLNLKAINLNNEVGLIQAAGSLNIELKKKGEDPIQGIFQNFQGQLLSDQTLALKAFNLNNREGKIAAQEALTLTLADRMHNSAGSIVGAKDVNLSSDTFSHNEGGEIHANDNLILAFTSAINNRAKLSAANTITLSAPNGLG